MYFKFVLLFICTYEIYARSVEPPTVISLNHVVSTVGGIADSGEPDTTDTPYIQEIHLGTEIPVGSITTISIRESLDSHIKSIELPDSIPEISVEPTMSDFETSDITSSFDSDATFADTALPALSVKEVAPIIVSNSPIATVTTMPTVVHVDGLPIITSHYQLFTDDEDLVETIQATTAIFNNIIFGTPLAPRKPVYIPPDVKKYPSYSINYIKIV